MTKLTPDDARCLSAIFNHLLKCAPTRANIVRLRYLSSISLGSPSDFVEQANLLAKPPAHQAAIRDHGFCLLTATQYAEESAVQTASAAWREFAESWADMPQDRYMADQGRYRRRRHAVLSAAFDGQWQLTRLPPQPHIQALDYNPLNGGIERWFAPIAPHVIDGTIISSVLGHFLANVADIADHYRVEVHQFRIEARAEQHGLPTPEGVHRDGVDFVLVLLVARININAGTTELFDAQRQPIGQFTLIDPLQCVLIDDHRIFHGVTAVTPIDPVQPAFRDVLVVTLKHRD